MTNTSNLWPNLSLEGATTPRSILIEQAQHLSNTTKNVLKGDVERLNVTDSTNHLSFRFNIIAPALNDYLYHLFSIKYSLLNMYPVSIKENGKSFLYPDETKFKARLKVIFSSNETTKILQSLYAQSVDETPKGSGPTGGSLSGNGRRSV